MSKKIGIVGSGVAGLTAAKHLAKSNSVTVFEKKRIGGRVKTLILDEIDSSMNHDVGAEFFVSSHTALLDEVTSLGLDTETYLSKRAIRLTNGKTIVFPQSSDSFITKMKRKFQILKFTGYKVQQLKLLNQLVDEFGKEISRIYDIFDSESNSDVAFKKIRSEYKHLMSITLFDYFQSRGISESLIMNFVDPIIRSIYLLGAKQISAFLAALAFAAKKLNVYRVSGGNYKLIKRQKEHFLITNLNQSQTNSGDKAGYSDYLTKPSPLIRDKVVKIEKRGDLDFKIYTQSQTYCFSFLFLAIPLTSLQQIEFKGFTKDEMDHLSQLWSTPYNTNVYHYTVKATPNVKLKSVLMESDTIYTNDPYVYEINKISYDEETGSGYFDLTCSGPMSTDATSGKSEYTGTSFAYQLSEYFETDNHHEFKLIHSVHWNPAYPLYTPEVILNIPTSNRICQGLYAGTDNLLTSLDSSVRIAKDFVQHVLNTTIPISIANS